MLQAVRDNIYTVLKGDGWVGLRVRVATVRVPEHVGQQQQYSNQAAAAAIVYGFNSLTSQDSAFCSGTVIYYSPAVDKHFVVFDEDSLQPQWVTCQKRVVDVLLGPAEGSGTPSAAATRASSKHREEFDCSMCGIAGCAEHVRDGYMMQCQTCSLVCHSYCLPMPSPQFQPNTTSKKDSQVKQSWSCWNCLGESIE